LAIRKEKILDNGVTVNYHRIVRCPAIINSTHPISVEVICEEYLSKEDKGKGKSPVSARSYSVEMSKSDIETDNVFAVVYTKLMLLPEFDGATEE
jgi:hypothetical protein